MVRHILGVILQPFFTCFSSFDLDGNFIQSVLLTVVVLSVIDWLRQLFTY